ncbi:HEPN domain-containing protein [Nitrospira sp. M1]
MDVKKHIQSWIKSTEEDWDIAKDLVERKKVRHGLFFAHLALEKALKTHVCQATQDIAPRSHHLSHLAKIRI